MKVEYVEETSVKKALTFEIEAEVVLKELEVRTKDYARKMKLPGFRPGRIPAEVVKKRFHDQLMGDVAEAIVNRVVFEELEGRGLRPLAMPKVADLKIDEGVLVASALASFDRSPGEVQHGVVALPRGPTFDGIEARVLLAQAVDLGVHVRVLDLGGSALHL